MQNNNSKKNNDPIKRRKAIISNEVRGYGNDPFFIKKAKESKEFLEKHGFPEDPRRSLKNI